MLCSACSKTVLEIRGTIVKLGFEAAAEVPIYRWEVWNQIQAADPRDGPAGELSAPVAS